MILESIRQAIVTLRLQRLRTFLTMFGVVWGTASVIFLLSWGEGVRQMLESGFTKIGKDMATVWAGQIGENFTPAIDRRYLWFTREDEEAVARRARLATLVGAESELWTVVGFGQRAFTMSVRGVEAANFELRSVSVASGRPISRFDVQHRRRVAVLGVKARDRLLGAEGRVGSTVRIHGNRYEVIGLLERVGTQLWRDSAEIDEQVWIPITTLLAIGPRYGIDDEITDMILFRYPGRHAYDAAKREVRSILAKRLRVSTRDEEAIHVVSAADALKQIPIDDMQGLFLILAVTTLVIGGVGVMNMMLDSVQERRSEIGVRLAVGARRRDVVAQFFLETVAMTGIGGLAGVGLGIAGSLALGSLEVPDVVPIPVLQGWAVATAVGVMTGVGVLAGLVPAWRAARVDPSLILRVE